MQQRNRDHLKYLFLMFICWVITACYEPIEECLDPLATNFSLNADSDCEDCCEFPTVNLRFRAMWDTLDIETNVYYKNAEGLSIFVDSVRFFVSNMYLTQQSTVLLSSQDYALIDCQTPLTIYDTFKNISLESERAQINNIRLDKGFDMVHIDIGIPDCLSQIDRSAIDFLSSSTELFENELSPQSYVSYQFDLILNHKRPIKRSFQLINADGLTSLAFRQESDIKRGSNLSIDIDVDYSVWFRNITSNDSDQEIKQKLKENAAQSFSLRE